MKSKLEFFRKGVINGGKPNIVVEIKSDHIMHINDWSNTEHKEALSFLKGVRERLNSLIIEFEDLDNLHEENQTYKISNIGIEI